MKLSREEDEDDDEEVRLLYRAGTVDTIAVTLRVSRASRPADSTEGHLAATRRRMRSEDEVEEEDEVEDAGG